MAKKMQLEPYKGQNMKSFHFSNNIETNFNQYDLLISFSCNNRK